MLDMWATNTYICGDDERSHSAGKREGRLASEPAARPCDLQQPERQQAELFKTRLLEGFGYLLNRECAELISQMAEEFFNQPKAR